MQKIKVKSLQEAARYLPMLGILHIGLALKQGHTVTIEDEAKNVCYVFEPQTINTSDIKETTSC